MQSTNYQHSYFCSFKLHTLLVHKESVLSIVAGCNNAESLFQNACELSVNHLTLQNTLSQTGNAPFNS